LHAEAVHRAIKNIFDPFIQASGVRNESGTRGFQPRNATFSRIFAKWLA
jgi:hypothetical protein